MNIEEGIENRVMNLNFKGKLNNGGYIMKSKKNFEDVYFISFKL